MIILSSIIPIFVVIFAGWVARKRGFLPDGFLGPANRLVYYLAIPAMIFRAISNGSFHEAFDIRVLGVVLLSLLLVLLAAWVTAELKKMPENQKGTFLQSSFHGNLGYIGLAVVFYHLGESGLAAGGLFAGFIMIAQNILAVFVLQIYSGEGRGSPGRSVPGNLRRIIFNPVILAAFSGMLVSLSEMPLPIIIDRSLKILSGMALPLALLLIGATLSFDLIRVRLIKVAGASFLKLVIMPGLSLVMFRFLSIPTADFLPAFILMSAPTATLTYIMAKEMNGDSDFAVAAVSGCTLLSAVTFTLWLSFLS